MILIGKNLGAFGLKAQDLDLLSESTIKRYYETEGFELFSNHLGYPPFPCLMDAFHKQSVLF